MSLKIRYEKTCDFCGNQIGNIEEYTIEYYVPAENMVLPHPAVHGCGLGSSMACWDCLQVAREAVIELR